MHCLYTARTELTLMCFYMYIKLLLKGEHFTVQYNYELHDE